jgi:hypothetical protein
MVGIGAFRARGAIIVLIKTVSFDSGFAEED